MKFHNHSSCSHSHIDEGILLHAEALLSKRGQKLTDLRRNVLQVLAGSSKAMGAYDVIEAMSRLEGKPPAPITVYRVLDFLLEQGLVHRIHAKNAYICCSHHHDDTPVLFLVCENCDCVTELHDEAVIQVLDDVAVAAKFKPNKRMIELYGECGHCGK